MRKIVEQMILLLFFSASAVLWALSASAASVITHVQPTDVTPSGFSVIWQLSEAAGTGISVYSDPDGATEITSNLEITYYPVHTGKTDGVGDYQKELDKDALATAARNQGLVKISVNGCKPETTYFFKVRAESNGAWVFWPETVPASVTTAAENSFVNDARHLLLTLSNSGGNLNAAGWLVTASSSGIRSPISEFVSDGTGENQVYINLSRLFASSGRNWMPTGSQLVRIQMLGPGSRLLNQTVEVDFSDAFSVAVIDPMNVNIDSLEDGTKVTLADVIFALQVLVRMNTTPGLSSVLDINGDGRIGVAEVINALQLLVELRQ